MTHDLELACPANRLPPAKAADAAHRPARGPARSRAGELRRPAGPATSPADVDPPGQPGLQEVAGRTEAAEERPHLELTATQLGIGAAAAVTTAVLGSTLGVAGTVVGAGVGSAISITASAVYTHSLAATRRRWQRTRAAIGGRVAPSAQTVEGAFSAVATPDRAAAKPAPSTRRPAGPGRFRWSGVLAGALGTAIAFAAALLVITGIESVTGHPLAGGAQGGLSVLGGSAGQPDPAYPVTSSGDDNAPVTSTVTESTVTRSTVTHSETVVSTVTTTPSAAPAGGADSGTSAGSPDSDADATDATREAGRTEDPPTTGAPAGPDEPSAPGQAGADGSEASTGSGDPAGDGSPSNGTAADGDPASSGTAGASTAPATPGPGNSGSGSSGATGTSAGGH